jgi:hypothetical protein
MRNSVSAESLDQIFRSARTGFSSGVGKLAAANQALAAIGAFLAQRLDVGIG